VFVWVVFFRGNSIIANSNRTPSPVSTQIEISSVATITSSQKPALAETSSPDIFVTDNPPDGEKFTFDIQAEPQSISASLFRSERKCNWMGVAGQAFDLQGRSVPGITVQVTGPLYGKEIQFLSLTGAAPWYGAGGYEVFLSDKPFDSKDLFHVRLVDQAGRGLSPRISFSTSIDCEKNLAIINFRQIK
jgi:hypothetical protein